MRFLHIKSTSRKIPVSIGADRLKSLPGFLTRHYPWHSVFLITDSNVGRFHGETVAEVLAQHRGFGNKQVFPAGEASKSREQKAALEDALLKHHAGRDSVLIALGGGVTGDLAGYVAATLHRGVPLIHLPTSLLAQVDSSIGGKTGINHPAGKNLLGAFYQPAAVFIDVNFLETLPESELRNGLAEVIKYGFILDENILEILENHPGEILSGEKALLARLIERCVELKIRVVERDETESDYRSILNFGHTVGHAIEKLSGYAVKHGFAVAAGMRAAVRLSNMLLDYPEENFDRLQNLLDTYRLNEANLNQYPLEKIWNTILTDKKARSGSPAFTLLDSAGKPSLFHPVTRKELENAIRSL